mmetsp:Transcript_47763/g.55248  ORF Transcript_47763/g.55248 Transcript_47763/m.55248 type:complete len:219 (+) Transcript_47763:44-700(+)
MADQGDDIDYDFLFKIVIIGDSGAGKSNLLLRYTKNEFNLESKATIGVEFATKAIIVDNKTIKAQIWDTAGQERFQALTSAYFRGATGALLVYDITKPSSFEHLEKWLNKLKQNADPNITTLLVGNKCDLGELRAVNKDDAAEYAKKNNLAFLETSALDSTNVDLAFQNLISAIYQQLSTTEGKEKEAKDQKSLGNKGETVKLDDSKTTAEPAKKGCC